MSVEKVTLIHSTFSDDPDMIELVEEFVGHLAERVEALETAVAENDLEPITRLAHQLKGASGGYGFDVIGEAAAGLEAATQATESVAQVQGQVSELIALCRRATADPAPPPSAK